MNIGKKKKNFNQMSTVPETRKIIMPNVKPRDIDVPLVKIIPHDYSPYSSTYKRRSNIF